MEFYDVPLRVESNPRENVTNILLERVKKNPSHPLFSRKKALGAMSPRLSF
jgi:hypothetical protein